MTKIMRREKDEKVTHRGSADLTPRHKLKLTHQGVASDRWAESDMCDWLV